MRLRRLSRFGLAALALAVVVQTAAAGSLYTDAVGDTTAADVEQVIVTNDSAGQITFLVKFRNHPTALKNDRFLIYPNTDRKSTTGGTSGVSPAKDGADYIFFLTGGSHTISAYHLMRGQPPKFFNAKTLKSTCCSSGWLFSINRREIGNPKVFDFYVYTQYVDPSKKRFDYAPSRGVYKYTLTGLKS